MMSGTALRFSLLLAFALIAPSAFAQGGQIPRNSAPVEIRGQVRLVEGGAPAENVVVRLDSSRGGYVAETVTDRSGKFRFSGLTPDDYTVKVHTLGYKDAEQRVDLLRISSDYVFLQLAPDGSAAAKPALAPAMLIDANVPPDARKEFEAGREAVMTKKLDAGITHLQKAVAAYPNFFEAHLLLGTAYLDTRKLDKSEASLRRALEIKPKTTAALFALGEVYREQKKYDEAEKALKDGLEQDERSAQGRFTLGRVYYEKGEIVKAGPEVGRAIRLKPDFAEAHLLAGNILLRARQAENALVEFQEYLRLDPKGEFAEQARQIAEKIKRALAEKKN